MQIPSRHHSFWMAFAQRQAADPTPRFLEAFHFDDNERAANALAGLVLDGQKRATAALLWCVEHDNKRLPKEGDLSIVTDFGGNALCVIETRQVDVVPFDEVTSEFAAVEGEGDRSLAYWRRVHEVYFDRECARIGRTPEANMPVICERFEVVYRPGSAVDNGVAQFEGLIEHQIQVCPRARWRWRLPSLSADRQHQASVGVAQHLLGQRLQWRRSRH